MNKKQYTIPIIGLDKHDNPARIGEDVQSWQNASGQFAAWSDRVNMFVQTHKGITKLEPHKTTKNLCRTDRRWSKDARYFEKGNRQDHLLDVNQCPG